MACTSCGKKNNYKNIEKTYHKLVNTYKPKSCDLTEEDLISLRDKLKCIKSKISFVDYNKQLGFLKSMLTLRDYCRYDLSILQQLIEEYECDT